MSIQTKSDKTKFRLADSLKECMKNTLLEEITVKQVVSVCGVTRQTFYRNFLDLNDLIQWYFNIILNESFHRMGSGETVGEGLVRKFRYIHEEHLFFTAAFSTDKENNLKDHDFHMILNFYRTLIREKTGEYPDALTDSLLEMYCQSSVYMTVKWVLNGMKQDEEAMADLMIEAMPDKLKTLFRKLNLIA